ncbi:MAG: N-acetylmuramoyl-L-alanine amidase [Kofleriaceae bacterium]
MTNLRVGLAALAALYLPSCTSEDVTPIDADDDHVSTPGLDDDFAAAERVHGVPADLLKAISYVETQWQMVDGQDEHDAGRQGAGLFALWGDNLGLGAAAANVSEDAARFDLESSIAAAAARLASLASVHGVSGGDLAAWAPVIGEFSQSPDDESRAAYVGEVMRVLSVGASAIDEGGTLVASIDTHAEIRPPVELTPPAGLSADYPAAIWRSSPNFNTRGGHNVSLVVIHSCEGNYAGCWGWLRNPAAQASAHYVVKENGSEVSQLVRESDRAWHVAAAYECSRAGGQQCNKNGVGTNSFSVGIEHAGFASQSSWQNGLIETSAKLTCDITRDHSVPRDRNHIVSHGQLQPWNRTDPGPNWPWNHYIDRVRDHCGGGGGGGGIIIDSNNANNNQSVAKIELAGAWTSSAGTPGYYGTGYWFAATAAVSQPATFWFYLPAAATKTVDAWWTAGTNRSTAAPFVAFNAGGGEVGRRTVNQQGSGSQWVTLGTWNFSAGWNKVVLSRWTSGSVVIADAVRVR